MSDWTDDEGYPTDSACKYISKWSYHHGYKSLLRFVRSLWYLSDWGWHEEPYEWYGEKGTKYLISTAGWSGNESLISALEENRLFWVFCWQESRRGGHYEFRIRKNET